MYGHSRRHNDAKMTARQLVLHWYDFLGRGRSTPIKQFAPNRRRQPFQGCILPVVRMLRELR